jgi:predicted ArsR family transcriptional regulator
MSWLEALSDPIRLRIVRCLARGGPASLPDLAEAAEVHRNTVRPHVARLESAGLLVRVRPTPTGPGRPVVRYRLNDAWAFPTADFQGLAELLSAALAQAGGTTPERRRAGEQWGRELARRCTGDQVEVLPLALERLGFHPELDQGHLLLIGCPCPLVSAKDPALVCDLAAGVVDGVLGGTGSPLRVMGRAHDPPRRVCSLALGQPA